MKYPLAQISINAEEIAVLPVNTQLCAFVS